MVQVQILTTTPRNAISTALEQEQMNKYEEMEAKEDQAARRGQPNQEVTGPGSDSGAFCFRSLSHQATLSPARVTAITGDQRSRSLLSPHWEPRGGKFSQLHALFNVYYSLYSQHTDTRKLRPRNVGQFSEGQTRSSSRVGSPYGGGKLDLAPGPSSGEAPPWPAAGTGSQKRKRHQQWYVTLITALETLFGICPNTQPMCTSH